MIEIVKSAAFDRWLTGLRDSRAAGGNFGDVKPIGDGVSEMRIDYGPGYRIYFMRRGHLVVVLLCGGDKSTQEKDVGRAKAIAAQWED